MAATLDLLENILPIPKQHIGIGDHKLIPLEFTRQVQTKQEAGHFHNLLVVLFKLLGELRFGDLIPPQVLFNADVVELVSAEHNEVEVVQWLGRGVDCPLEVLDCTATVLPVALYDGGVVEVRERRQVQLVL